MQFYTHQEKSQNNEEIAKILRKSKIEYYIPKSFDKTILYKFLKGRKFDLGLTIWSSYIFSPEIINLFPRGIVNIYNSFLPENKGSNANVFHLQNKKPGATIHYVIQI